MCIRDSAWTQYTYQQLSLDVLAEFPQTGPPRVNYLYRGRAGSIVTMEEQQGGGAGKEYWFAQDGLGSTAAVTKQDGQSAHDYFYDPYGGIIDNNGRPEDSSNWTDPHNHYLLTGKEWDEESRLYYFGARYYDAAVGVWLTQDVYRGQVEQPLSLHRTLYVAANPVNHVDAYGYAMSANGYSGSGGGSTPISPPQPVPVNSAQQGNSPYEWKMERDEERFESSGGGGGGQDETADELGSLPRWLLNSQNLQGGPEPPGPEDDISWWVRPMGAVAESFQGIVDPARNPRMAAFNRSFWGGVNAWGDAFDMWKETVSYTTTAIDENRWEEARRGAWALAQEHWGLAKTGAQAAGQFVWGAVTTPVRIFTTDIPEFAGAISERRQGLDRGWDIIFTGTMLAGDVTAMYGMCKMVTSHSQKTYGYDPNEIWGAGQEGLFGEGVGKPIGPGNPVGVIVDGSGRTIPQYEAPYSARSPQSYGLWGPNRPLDIPPGEMITPENAPPNTRVTLPQGDINTLPAGQPSDPATGFWGDSSTKLLWTIDEQGAQFVVEDTPWPSSGREIPSHTNLSQQAYAGGEAWRTGPDQLRISAASRAFGNNPRGLSPTLQVGAAARYNAAVQFLIDLGLDVEALPFGLR